MVRFYVVFFLWICNKRGGFSSPCFPLDLIYGYRIFVSQNWHRKFVNRWRLITRRQRNERWIFQRQSPTNSAQQPAYAASSALCEHGKQRASTGARSSRSCSARWRTQLVQLQSMLHVQQKRASVCQFSVMWWQSAGVWTVVAVCGDGDWGRRKKNMILGFHGFYHGGPYGFISFPLGRYVLNFCI